jgi:hypothetical protein
MPWWEDDSKFQELRALERELWNMMTRVQESDHLEYEDDLHSLVRLTWLEVGRLKAKREDLLRGGAVAPA